MGEILVLVAAGSAAVGLVTLAVQYSRAWMEQVAASWQQAAALVGGMFTPKGGPWWNRTPMQIHTEIGAVALLVDHYTVSSGKSSVTYTRITARASGPPDLRLKIYEEGFLSVIGKVMGVQDVVVGDPAFDEAFIVKASDEDLARLWISPRLRRAALATREYQLTLEDGALRSIRVGLEDNAARLARAIRAAALFADRGQEIVDAWRKLARELGGTLSSHAAVWRTDEPAAIQIERHGTLITILADRTGAPRAPGRLVTRVRASRASSSADPFAIERRAEGDRAAKGADPFGDPAFAAAYEVRSSAPERIARRFTDELRREILATLPDEITGDEAQVALSLDGVELRRKRLEGAVAIVAALSAPLSEGPYR